MRSDIRNLWILTLLLYVFSYFFQVVNSRPFFDDWVLFHHDPEDMVDLFREIGFFLAWPGRLYASVFGLLPEGTFILRSITFLSMLGAGFCFEGILRRVKIIAPEMRWLLTTIFLIFPVNIERVAFGATHYAICYGAFFFAFWIFVRMNEAQSFGSKVLLRLVAIFIFCVSMTTNSFFMFYGLLPLWVALKILSAQPRSKLWHERLLCLTRQMLTFSDFWLLPIVMWVADQKFFPAYGEYEGYYNSFRNYSLPDLLKIYGRVFRWNFSEIMDAAFKDFFNLKNVIPMLSIFVASLCLTRRVELSPIADSKSKKYFLLLSGVIFLLGVAPYILVGKPPMRWDAQSRHQLLVPPGAAFLAAWIFALLFSFGKNLGKFRNLAVRVGVGFLLSSLALSNMILYRQFLVDGYKHWGMEFKFKQSAVIRNHSRFVVEDLSTQQQALNRTIIYNDYTGTLKGAFGDETRFMDNVNRMPLTSWQMMNHVPLRHRYNVKDYVAGPPQYWIRLESGPVQENVYRLLYLQLFAKQKLEAALAPMVSIRRAPIAPVPAGSLQIAASRDFDNDCQSP